MTSIDDLPEIDLSDPATIRDPFTTYGAARERAPIARTHIPGIGPVWVVTRYDDAKAMLGDPRFEINANSFTPPSVPAECRPYLRTMSELNGPEHQRLRRLVSPAFSARRAAEFRPRIARIVDRFLDALPAHADGGADGHADDGGAVDLLTHYARPLPIEVICELVGIPEPERAQWCSYGVAVAAGPGPDFAAAMLGSMRGAASAVAHRRAEPGDDLLSDLIRAQAADGDRLSDTEMVTLVWHLVLAGQTPAHLIANAVAVLLAEPGAVAALRDDPSAAVEELMRWCGPTLLSIPRYARADVELGGVLVRTGEPVTASIAAVNRDHRAFDDPDRLDLGRDTGSAAHLGFAHGAHFCLGAALARVETEVALTALLRRFPDLALAVPAADVPRALDPGTWRLTALPVRL